MGRSGIAIKFATRCLFEIFFFFFFLNGRGQTKASSHWRLCRVCDCWLRGLYPHTVAAASTFFLLVEPLRKKKSHRDTRKSTTTFGRVSIGKFYFLPAGFFLKKKEKINLDRERERDLKEKRVNASQLFSFSLLLFSCTGCPGYPRSSLDKSMGFMNPLTSYSLF